MTRVEFFDQDGRITGFSCSGHSGYAEEGSDIVCAAVSTAVKFAECTINDVLGERAKTRVKEDEARISPHTSRGMRKRRSGSGGSDRHDADALLPAG